MARPRLSEALRDLNTVLSSLDARVEAVGTNIGAMTDPIVEATRKWKEYASSVEETVDSTEDMLALQKQLTSQALKLKRVQVDDLKNTESMKKALEAMKEGYQKLANSPLVSKKQQDDALARLGKVDALIGKMGGTIDDSLVAEFAAFVGGIKEAQRELEKLDFAKPISGVDKLGRAFDGMIKGLTVLDNHGFKGMFGRIQTMRSSIAKMQEDFEKMGKQKVENLVKRGVISQSMADQMADHRTRRAGVGQLASSYAASGDQAGMLRMLSGKTGMVGGVDRWLTRRALGSAAAGGGGLVGRIGGSLMGAGGGSVMSGMGAMAMRAAGPLSAISAVLELLQQGTDRNKSIYEKLGRGGLVGSGSTRDAYQEWSGALTSKGTGFGSGTGTFYGINFEKALDVMKEVVESGQTIGGMSKGRNIDQVIGGGRATDVYSGVMRNAAIFGKASGMGETEAAQNSMKFMHEFNLSMGEVEDMFINIGKATKVTGISTTKYLNLIDGITGQFDKMNKSLNYTVGLLNTLGRNAKYTAEDIQGMVKGMMGEKKDLTLSTFAYQQMGGEGRKNYANALQGTADKTANEVAKALGISPEEAAKLNDNDLLNAVKPGEKDQQALVNRYIQERLRARATKANINNPLGMASVDMNLGDNAQASMVKNLSLLQTTMKESGGGGLLNLMGNSKSAMSAKSNLASSPVLAEMSKVLGVDAPSALRYMDKAMNQMSGQFNVASGTDDEALLAQQKLGLSPAQITALQEQTKGGISADKTQVFKDWFEHSGIAGMGEVITEEMRTEAKDKAEENQRFITGPMDYIKKALAALVDNMIKMLTTLVNWANFSMFETDAAKQAKNEESAKGFLNNGVTLAGAQQGASIMKGTGMEAYGKHVVSAIQLVANDGDLISTGTQESIRTVLTAFQKDTNAMAGMTPEEKETYYNTHRARIQANYSTLMQAVSKAQEEKADFKGTRVKGTRIGGAATDNYTPPGATPTLPPSGVTPAKLITPLLASTPSGAQSTNGSGSRGDTYITNLSPSVRQYKLDLSAHRPVNTSNESLKAH